MFITLCLRCWFTFFHKKCMNAAHLRTECTCKSFHIHHALGRWNNSEKGMSLVTYLACLYTPGIDAVIPSAFSDLSLLVSVQTPMWSTRAFWKKKTYEHVYRKRRNVMTPLGCTDSSGLYDYPFIVIHCPVRHLIDTYIPFWSECVNSMFLCLCLCLFFKKIENTNKN